MDAQCCPALAASTAEAAAHAEEVGELKEKLEQQQKEIVKLSGHNNTKQKIMHLVRIPSLDAALF